MADLMEWSLDEVDDVYARSDMQDEDGTLNMQKVKETIGVRWTYE
jgi:hypothetical protein